mgnify:CR=1 FL=1
MTDKIWILGPCCMEDWDLYSSTAEKLMDIMGDRNWYYKASFDKANRTAYSGGRGPGFKEGLNLVEKLKNKHPNIKLTTDVHETNQVEPVSALIDVVQIPAFLCRQTDLLYTSAAFFDIVNIKKGQWINPDSAKHMVGKVKHTNPNVEVWLTERGTQFGYSQLIVDFGAVDEIKPHFDRIILDCTHSTQRKKGDFTGGDRELAERYFLASSIFGYNGIFAEVHPYPPSSVSDADCQIYLDKVQKLITVHDEIEKLLLEFGDEGDSSSTG